MRTKGELLSPVRVQFDYEVVRPRRRRRAGDRAHRARGARSRRGRPCRLPDRVAAGVRMKALVTGAAGFIGSHLAERLLDRGADVVGIDCFTDYYPRADEGSGTSRPARPARASASSSRGSRTPISARCSTARRTCSIWRRRPACGKAGDAISRSTPRTTSRRRNCCSRRASDAPARTARLRVELVGVWRQRPDADAGRRAAAASVAVRRHEAGGRAAVLPLLTSTIGVPTVSLRYFTVYGPRQRPDMGFHRFFTAALDGEPITLYGDGEQTRDFTFVHDAVSGNHRRGRARRSRAACTILEAARASR